MRNSDHEKRPGGRRGTVGLGVLGIAAILVIAVVSAYAVSDKDAPVKPATGAANAMALASSKPASR